MLFSIFIELGKRKYYFKDSRKKYTYEQIRNIELERHGQDVLKEVDDDLKSEKIKLITNKWLKEQGVLSLFNNYVKKNRALYNPGDLGEVYAISLAETLGAYALITDDIKQGGPYMSLLQFPDNEIMPFTFIDILLLNYLEGRINAKEIIHTFDKINNESKLNWNFRSHLAKFVKRFWHDPYQENERIWMHLFCEKRGVQAKSKLIELNRLL